MKIKMIAVLGVSLMALMMGCRNLPIPVPSPTAAIVAAGVAGHALRARQARARAYYARTRTPVVEPRRSYSDPWGWESEEDVQPAPKPAAKPTPARPYKSRKARSTHKIDISLTYHSTIMGATYGDHRNYLVDYDETHLGDAFDINNGTVWELAFRLKPRKHLGLRARLEHGNFEADTSILEIASGFEGLLFTSGSSGADLTFWNISLQADFVLSTWRGGELHLLAGLEYLRTDIDTPTITDTIEGLGFDGALELGLVMVPKHLNLELGVELGLGFDYFKAGANVGLCWKPVDFLHLRIGLRGRTQAPDDVHSDTNAGESMDLIYGDLYTGIALQF